MESLVRKFVLSNTKIRNDPKISADSLGKRVAKAAETAGGVPALAEKTGIKRNTIYGWIKGPGEPRASDLVAISNESGFTVEWLATGLNAESSALGANGVSGDSSRNTISVPRYAVQPSAGNGAAVISQDVEDFMAFDRDWLSSIAPRGARLGIVAGRGDSMEPTIGDGDVLIVTFDVHRQDLAAGGVFVFTYEGDIYLKRLSLALDGSVQVISDNPAYPMQTISADVAESKLAINARVIWAGGPLR